MKLLLDQGLPRAASTFLRNAGFDAIHTGDIGLATAEDAEILRIATEQERSVVTLDADFHSLLAQSGARLPSVIRIRIEGLRGEALARLLTMILMNYARELTEGVAMTVQATGIRLRRLPLKR